MSDQSNYFNRMLRGELPQPPVALLLGGQVTHVDAAAGQLTATYRAADTFLNPAGLVQGGMLSAMLDDATASLVDATLVAGESVATLNLNVSFLRPARTGELTAQVLMVRKGRDICNVSATLDQAGQTVATAVAVCKVLPARSAPVSKAT